MTFTEKLIQVQLGLVVVVVVAVLFQGYAHHEVVKKHIVEIETRLAAPCTRAQRKHMPCTRDPCTTCPTCSGKGVVDSKHRRK